MWMPGFVARWLNSQAEEKAETIVRLRMIRYEQERDDLLERIRKLSAREKVPVSVGDPLPVDKEQRRAFVGAVAGLHNEVLRPKLLQMISEAREIMDNEDNTHEQDLMLKGTSHAFWELLRWGDAIVNEDQAYNSGQNPSVPGDKKQE